ncbi:conserved hypothetical protein [uncultured Pleomorphomonas sp.]|uniref:Glycosyltransferase 2-like domain-containing protein n=1 Tax=uncultured Pleomorphomonas sp. TaxID=442121 RepID=A0A212LNY3_9HYPH|nr:glycosyltransferase family 2 protein [uncultured Pleomorphomonas sp.]SCM79285.1 conserved hypothetical protein [uncultured Pleomorphomonas sp.]
MEKAKLVVAFPAYNGARTLLASLQNIADQDFTDFRAIIVENCSTDDTYEVAKAFCEKDARFEVIRNDKHLAAVENFIRAVRLAKDRGYYFCLRACDDLSTLDYLSKLVAALDDDPSKLLAAGASKRFNGDRVQLIRPAPEVTHFLESAKEGRPPKSLYFPSDWIYGIFRSEGGSDIFFERVQYLGTPWCAASYIVYELVMRGLVVYVEGPFFHFYYGQNSEARYAARTLKGQFVERWRYTFGCYRVIEKLPPLSLPTKLRILRMLWRDSRWRTGYRLRKTAGNVMKAQFAHLMRRLN